MFLKRVLNPVAKQTFIYTATDAISKGISFLVIPFMSYYLTPDQLGIAANFEVLQSIVILLAGLVVVNGLPYFYYERDKQAFALFVSNLIMVFTVLTLLLGIICLFLSSLITEKIQLTLAMQGLVFVVVLSQLLSSTNTIIYRLEEKPIAFGIIQINQTILVVLFLVVFVVNMKMGAMGKILSTVCAFSIMAIINLFLLIKRGYINFKVDKQSIKEIYKFGLPLLPHSLSFWLKGGADKILITTFCGLTYNGLYSMALSFGGFYSIVNTAFNNAYVPYLQKRLSRINENNDTQEKKRIVGITYLLMGGFFVLSVLIVGLCYILIKFFLDSSYADSFYFIPWIILSLTINTMYSLVIQFPYTIKKTIGLGAITFSGSVLQILLTYILIRCIGIAGVNYSLVLGSLIILIGVWWYSDIVYPMPWFSLKR